MSGSFIENLNPFLLPLFTAITVAVLHYTFRINNTPGRLRRLCHAVPFSPRRTHQVLLFVVLIAFIGVVQFEYYFQYQKCAVSLRYYEENVRLFRQVTEILSSVGIIWWVDMATLLSAVRNQPVTVWDHDTDISLIHPDSLHIWRQLIHQQLGGSEYVSATMTVSDIIATMNQHGVQAFYIPERELIPVRWSDNPFGPHTDFWLWHVIAADSSTSSAFLTTVERSIVHSRRTYHEIFPLMPAVIFNVNVSIPHDSHGVSAREYNHYGGNYMQTQWFRKDCLHNWWQSRVSY